MKIFQNSWIHSKGHVQGILWMLMVCFVSNLNDILIKYVGGRLSGAEVAFFRFFFSTIVLIPFMITQGKAAFLTHHSKIHFIRALLLVFAIAPWCYGVASLPLTLATTISFTTPLFVLPLARIFLKEYVGWRRWCATILGFFGIMISSSATEAHFNPMALILLVSTMMFASLDIINKSLLIKDESLLTMLFYSALGTTILGFIPAFLTWESPTLQELFFLLLLGGGANLILYCLLKAFAATEISVIQPFRYLELILSATLGLIIFHEIPPINTFLGAAIIIPTTLYIAFYEMLTPETKIKTQPKNKLTYDEENIVV